MPNLPKTFYAKTRKEWRAWLKKNHKKENRLGLILYKKYTGKPTLNHRVAMEEAISFGWIDTTGNKLDEERYIINFAKRNKNSKWGNTTLRLAKELKEQGKMSEQGLEAYEQGLLKPTYDFGIPDNPSMPRELRKVLVKNKAIKNFNSFSPSYKRTLLRWLFRAKLPETRKKRIRMIVNFAKKKDKNGIYWRKKER
jgi:uncharacterized protein YdeI (YjbR/CyaY-like superfamily)